MNTTKFVAAIAAIIATTISAQARVHHRSASTHVFQSCLYDNDGRIHCDVSTVRTNSNGYARSASTKYQHQKTERYFRVSSRDGVTFIPNPPGTWRIARSCAHRLAAYWHLGKGLDAVSEWPRIFARTVSPGVGVAAVRNDRHHIMGIIGGGPGAWRVADFNSGGHRNREYTVASFRGYFFVDTRMRIASR